MFQGDITLGFEAGPWYFEYDSWNDKGSAHDTQISSWSTLLQLMAFCLSDTEASRGLMLNYCQLMLTYSQLNHENIWNPNASKYTCKSRLWNAGHFISVLTCSQQIRCYWKWEQWKQIIPTPGVATISGFKHRQSILRCWMMINIMTHDLVVKRELHSTFLLFWSYPSDAYNRYPMLRL